MNKLRLIRIFEIRKQVHPIEQYVIDILDGIEEVSNNDSIGYCKNGIFYFSYHLNSNNIYYSGYLEDEFKDNFGCPYVEIIEIMKYLLEKHLKITINGVY